MLEDPLVHLLVVAVVYQAQAAQILLLQQVF